MCVVGGLSRVEVNAGGRSQLQIKRSETVPDTTRQVFETFSSLLPLQRQESRSPGVGGGRACRSRRPEALSSSAKPAACHPVTPRT